MKIMTRPMFTIYEKVFRIFYKFLKLEFEEALEKKNDKKYIELLTTRIAYSGTDLISKNKDKLKELDCDNTIITKSILWENAYKNGVI